MKETDEAVKLWKEAIFGKEKPKTIIEDLNDLYKSIQNRPNKIVLFLDDDVEWITPDLWVPWT